jgi:type VI secretion system protein ImpA
LVVLDLAQWLNPIDDENPSGRDLRENPEFDALGRLMQARVDIVRDDRNNPVSKSMVPVDWAAVLQKADELKTHGRDLRLLVIVARALLNQRGLEGLAEGLTLIARSVEVHWESLHPELRAAARPIDAAQRRVAALRTLEADAGRWKPNIGELAGERPEGVLGDLRCRTFFVTNEFGAVAGRDLELGALDGRTALAESAQGLPEAERAKIVREHEALVERVRGACTVQASGPTPAAMAGLAEDQRARVAERTLATRAEMEGLVVGLRAVIAALDDVEAAITAKVGEPVTLPALKRFLARIQLTLERAVTGATAVAAPPTGATALVETAGAVPAPSAPAVPGQINSREDVILCLDRIIEFYNRTEPASPVPFLAKRMRRMVPMDFLKLIEDLAPSGLKEFRLLAGLTDDKKDRSSG